MPFRMVIDRVEAIPGGGTIAHGQVAEGEVTVGDDVVVEGAASPFRALVAGVTVDGRLLDHAAAGARAGVFLRRVDPSDVSAGATLTAL